MEYIIANIPEKDWCGLRDRLARNGWSITRGGGFDHSWAMLRRGNLQILMEYDRWDEGKISFDQTRQDDVLAQLPDNFLNLYVNIPRCNLEL